MAVQFILGANPYKKRTQLIDKMYVFLRQNEKANMLYLVPDNVKYETETMILEQFMAIEKDASSTGMMRLQVFSFSRLAWYFLQNQPIYQQVQLTNSGLAMIMKKIITEEEQNLSIYRGASHQEGFIERLINMFSELRNGKITPEDLIEILNAAQASNSAQDFIHKAEDLALLYQRYDEALADKYVEKDDLYDALINHIKNNKENLKDFIIIIDHYEHFSAQEQEILTTLAKYTKQLYISLTLEDQIAFENNDFNNPYYRPTKTYQQLTDVFQSHQVPVMDDLIISDNQLTATDSEVIEVANYWMQSSQFVRSSDLEHYQNHQYDNLEIWSAEDKQVEVFHIATKIKIMVASGKYRYNDFQIMTRDIEGYELHFQSIFNESEIPMFIDQAETMAQHPLLEFVVSLFLIKKRYYRTDDILRLLRTELLVPNKIEDLDQSEMIFAEKEDLYKSKAEAWRHKVDIAENVALAYGYRGNDWVNDEEWHYTRFELDDGFNPDEAELVVQAKANEVRTTFKECIVPFINQLDDEKTNREIATLLFQFMEDEKVIDQIQYWRNSLVNQGDLEEARKHEQAWDTFVQLLDEFVEILGDEKWDIDLFLSIIQTGFEEATFSMVPPAIDQVLITNFDLPKIQRKKVVFQIGLTDTQFPKIPSNQSLLTDEDREIIDENLTAEKYLAVSEIETVANEPFAMYLAILQSKEKIFFTYPSQDEEGEESRMSPYINRIKDAFALKTKMKYSNIVSIQKVDKKEDKETIEVQVNKYLEQYLGYVSSKSQTFGQILISLRHAMDNNLAAHPFVNSLFKAVYTGNNNRQNYLFNSLRHKNIPKPIPMKLAEKLYGKDLYLSVSQLETFYQDPYSHFLLYGLRLQERAVQELSPLETGIFFHETLDLIINEFITLKKDLADISASEVLKITEKITQELIQSRRYRLAQSSNRMNFIYHQLIKTVAQSITSIVKQAQHTKFRPNRTELLFGRLGDMQGVQGLTFPLENDGKLYLRGKIDRIDTITIDNQLYAGVVDYKSSETTFNFQKIYYGLMLQMLTYLDTVLSNSEEIFGEKATNMGAFYSQIQNPFIDLRETNKRSIDELFLREYKYKGLIINEKAVLEAADTSLKEKDSNIYPIYLKTSGDYSEGNVLTEEEYNLLLKFNRQKIQDAGNRIILGETALKPFEDEKYTPSVSGPYRAISQFDALLPENNYQEMKKVSRKTFFKIINEGADD